MTTDVVRVGDAPPTTSRARRLAVRSLLAVGIILQLAVLMTIVVSTLLAPPWAVVVGAAVWVSSLAPFVWAFRTRPWATPVVALAVLAAWIAFITLGDLAFGWTA